MKDPQQEVGQSVLSLTKSEDMLEYNVIGSYDVISTSAFNTSSGTLKAI